MVGMGAVARRDDVSFLHAIFAQKTFDGEKKVEVVEEDDGLWFCGETRIL